MSAACSVDTVMRHIRFEIVWFDSLGAKSSCVLVRTPDVRLLIDPGVAVMHPSFPASEEQKLCWYERARNAIRSAAGKADMVTISHYHYDHFVDFDEGVYKNKLLFAKNPNCYINDSQRLRAEQFFQHLYGELGGVRFEVVLEEPQPRDYTDLVGSLLLSQKKDYGDYGKRRSALLKAGEKWFEARAKKWRKYRLIPELKLKKTRVIFPEGREFSFGGTKLRFRGPLFHGIEYSKVGWVFSIVVEHGGEKLIHSSDLNGPVIEDYAQWIVDEDPHVLFLDGPMTYMLGYTLNLINFNRTLQNALKIVRETPSCRLLIYDHHLPREPKFRDRTQPVWKTAEREGKKVTTAAEFVGKKPACLLNL